jgi:hypothetical protein
VDKSHGGTTWLVHFFVLCAALLQVVFRGEIKALLSYLENYMNYLEYFLGRLLKKTKTKPNKKKLLFFHKNNNKDIEVAIT